MQNLISNTFAISAQRPTVSIDHTDNYYLIEASGITPAVNDARWQYVPVGGNVLVPTAAYPYLWHKSITYLTDGTALAPVIEFGGSLGQNGIDYDLVPSHSSILKDENDNLTPSVVSCTLIKRNADGSANNQDTIPAGYSIQVIKDAQVSTYTLGSTVSTANCSVITFVLKYGSVEIERHDIRVIAEGTEGIAGRGIQSIDYRFKATEDGTAPAAPTSDNEWNTWNALQSAGYSSVNKYLWRCQRTIFVDGNGNTETQYNVDGPTVWGTEGKDAIFLDLDNEVDAIPADSTGKVLSQVTLVTHARLYKGASPITIMLPVPDRDSIRLANIRPSVSYSSGVFTITYTIPANTTLSASRYAISIPVTYDGNTYYATFTVNVVRSGSPGVSPSIYQLLLSETEASFSRNSSNELTPASVSIYCGYTKNLAGSIASYRGDQQAHLYNIDSTYNIFYRAVNADGSYGSWNWMKDLTSFALVIPSDTTCSAYEFILSSATAVGSIASSNIIDRETLPITKDGLNGTPGESIFGIDLDNETDAFGTDSNGKISGTVTRSTTVKMYYGLTPLAFTDLTYTKKYEDNTNCGNEVSVTASKQTGVVTVELSDTTFVYNKTIFIDITGTTTRGSKTIRFSLQPQAAGAPGETPVIYQLMPSPSALLFSRDDNNNLVAVKNTVYAYVKVIEGEDTQIKTSAITGYRVYWGYDEPATPTNFISVGGSKTVSVADATSHSSITLELWRMNGSTKLQRLDRETIPFNKEGQKGNPGAPGDNGETPFIIDIDNEMTSLPVDQGGRTTTVHDLYFNLAAYYGQTPVINDCTVEAVDIPATSDYITADVTTDKTRPHIQIQSGFGPIDMIELRFRVTHPNYGSRDAVFSIAFVKAGGQGLNAVLYELMPSLSQISVGRNDNGTYNPSTVALTCGYTKTDGPATTPVADCTAAFDGYDIYFRRYVRASGAWQTTYYRYRSYKSYLASLNVSTYSKVQFIICKNTTSTISNANLDDANVTGLIDRETVPVVADGQKGPAGTNAFVIDLDNEMDGCAVLLSGAASAAQTWQITARAFYGSSELGNSSGVTFKILNITGNTSNGLVTLKNNADATVTIDDELPDGILNIASSTGTWTRNGAVKITLQATHATYGSRTAIFTLKPIFPGENGTPATVYQLLLSRLEASFARDNSNNLTPASVNINVGYTKNYNGTLTSYPGTNRNNLWTSGGAPYNIFYRPLKADGTYGSWAWMKDLAAANNYALVIGNNTTYTAYEFILSSASGVSNIADSNIIDRETIPITKDGEKGDTGTGIRAITYHRMFTINLVEPAINDSGWIASTSSSYPSEESLSEEKRFLWQKKTTTYTDNSVATTYEVVLLAQFNTGMKENLLEDTAFLSEGQMDAWDIKNGSVNEKTIAEHNSFGLTQDFTQNYQGMLRQIVYKNGEVKKLKPNTWYTLSFYAAMLAKQPLFSGNDYNGNGNTQYSYMVGSYKKVWLDAGQSMDIEVTAYCASSNVFLRYFAWSYDTGDSTNWKNTTKVDFTETTATTKTMRVTNVAAYGRLFHLRGYVYLNGTFVVDGQSVVSNPSVASPLMNNATNNPNNYANSSYRCYITDINMNRGSKLATYLYRSDNGQAVQHSSSVPWLVDGKKVTAATTLDDAVAGNDLQNGTRVGFSNDGCVYWQLRPGTVRHSVTFKTPSTLSSSTTYFVLFRMYQYSHYGWVCMPKLEENTMATDWIEHTADRYSEDFQHILVGDWVASTDGTPSTYYHYDNGVRHVVRAKESANSSNKVYFRMKKRTTSVGYCSLTQPYLDTEHWEQAANLRFVSTELMLADQAIINLAQTNRILIPNAAGTGVAAGLGGAPNGNTDYPLWIGETFENRAQAAFRVNLQGKLFASGAEISGKISATEGTIGGFTLGSNSIVSSGSAVLRIGTDSFKTQFGIVQETKTVQLNGSETGVVLVNYNFNYKENNHFTLRKTTTSYYNWTNFGAANVIDLDFFPGVYSNRASDNNYGYQYGMIGNGHIVMNGIVEGACFDLLHFSANNQVKMVQMPIFGNRIVVEPYYDGCVLVLPDLYSMCSALGCGFIKTAATQPFTFRIDIVNISSSRSVYVAGWNRMTISSKQPFMNNALPILKYRSTTYQQPTDIYVRACNILSIMLVYNGSGNYSAFIINQPN